MSHYYLLIPPSLACRLLLLLSLLSLFSFPHRLANFAAQVHSWKTNTSEVLFFIGDLPPPLPVHWKHQTRKENSLSYSRSSLPRPWIPQKSFNAFPWAEVSNARRGPPRLLRPCHYNTTPAPELSRKVWSSFWKLSPRLQRAWGKNTNNSLKSPSSQERSTSIFSFSLSPEIYCIIQYGESGNNLLKWKMIEQ